MATMVMNGAKVIDTVIPDITKEEAKVEVKKILEEVKGAAVCAGAALWMSCMAAGDASWLVTRTSKTMLKEAGTAMKATYFEKATTVTIRR